MERKMIDRIIAESALCPCFEFGSDIETHIWYVTVAEKELVAKHVFGCGGHIRNYYYAVPYVSTDACKELYDDIVLSFVSCYALYLRTNSACSLGLFSDVASKDDCGLINVLSVFAIDYNEFLCDVFYSFGLWVDSDSTNKDGEVDYWREYYLFPNQWDEDAHLVKKVLSRISKATVRYYYEDNLCEEWTIAIGHDEIWFGHLVFENYDFWPCDHEEYGHISIFDENSVSSLRDIILGGLNDVTMINFETTGNEILERLQIDMEVF